MMDSQSRFNNRHGEFISSSEACALLDVKPATLYTYVSRGLVKTIGSGKGGGKRYALRDVLKLKSRADARAGHGPVAAAALSWGQPIIESSISTVGDEDGLTYRGHSVVELVQNKVPFEAVAELLWSGNLPEQTPNWTSEKLRFPVGLEALPANASPYVVVSTLLPLAAAADSARSELAPELERQRARRLLRLIASSVAFPESKQRAERALLAPNIASSLAAALGLPESGCEILNMILVLAAEHELNTSTFAARLAASAQADLFACLSAAVATLSGAKLGQSLNRVFALLAEIKQVDCAERVLLSRLERGESIPGFGQTLYPNGDPRAVPLIESVTEMPDTPREVSLLHDLVRAANAAGYYPPQLDLGIAMASIALAIPQHKANCLFMIGRFAGWIAHIAEQREKPELLRPRADHVPVRTRS